MGKSMRKFKKLAVLAITIPTLLSSTNISFAMKSPVPSDKCTSAFSPYSSNNYEIIYSSQSQEEDIYTSSKPIKPPAEDKKGKKGKKSRIEKSLECTNPKCPTYRKGEKCAGPYKKYIRIKDGAQMQQYRCKECRKIFTLDENGKVVKKVDRKNEYVECKRQKCKKYEKCAMPNGVPYTRIKDGKQIQRYFCTKCKTYFTQPINKNAEKQAGIETQPN